MITLIKGSKSITAQEVDYPYFKPEIYGTRFRVHEDELYINKHTSNPDLYTELGPKVYKGRPTTYYRISCDGHDETVSFKKVKAYYNNIHHGVIICWDGIAIATTSLRVLCSRFNCNEVEMVDKINELNDTRGLITIHPDVPELQ